MRKVGSCCAGMSAPVFLGPGARARWAPRGTESAWELAVNCRRCVRVRRPPGRPRPESCMHGRDSEVAMTGATVINEVKGAALSGTMPGAAAALLCELAS